MAINGREHLRRGTPVWDVSRYPTKQPNGYISQVIYDDGEIETVVVRFYDNTSESMDPDELLGYLRMFGEAEGFWINDEDWA